MKFSFLSLPSLHASSHAPSISRSSSSEKTRFHLIGLFPPVPSLTFACHTLTNTHFCQLYPHLWVKVCTLDTISHPRTPNYCTTHSPPSYSYLPTFTLMLHFIQLHCFTSLISLNWLRPQEHTSSLNCLITPLIITLGALPQPPERPQNELRGSQLMQFTQKFPLI